MLNVKKTAYGALSKNNGLLKLTSDVKHAIQKIEDEKNGYAKMKQWLCKINS